VNFLADESVDRQIVERLRVEGHSVWEVADTDPGISNGDVVGLANQNNAILLTADKDFGELVFHQRLVNQGVILIRLGGLSPTHKAGIVASAVKDHVSELSQAFSVITPSAIRIRRRID
jgi:predicted nuclease of predicted toxin-antitoxin system